MNILDDTNEWEPKEITLEYSVYKALLAKITSYPDIIKSLTEDGTHVLLKQNGGQPGKETFALISKDKFDQVKHQFNM
jgi:hypothetical protein